MKTGKEGRLHANWKSGKGLLRDLWSSSEASVKLYRCEYGKEPEPAADWRSADWMTISAPLDDGGTLDVEVEFSPEARDGDESATRGYYQLSESWYAKALQTDGDVVDEVMFGLYCHDCGTRGEMRMEWVSQGRGKPAVARLAAFEDAFDLLPLFADVWKELVGRRNMQPDTFCQVLKHCGFKDLTDRTGPKGKGKCEA